MRARDNPFRTERIDALAFRDPQITPDALLDRWRARGRRGAIVGPHGTGKTTLLETLIARLHADGLRVVSVRLSADGPRPRLRALRAAVREAGPAGVVCIDGIDLLSRFERAALAPPLARAHGVWVTSHRPGPWPTLHETRTSPELMHALATELLGDAADAHRATIARAFDRTGGNVRDALFDLYAEASRGRLAPGPAAD